MVSDAMISVAQEKKAINKLAMMAWAVSSNLSLSQYSAKESQK